MKYKKAIMAVLLAIIVLISVLIVFIISYFSESSNRQTKQNITWKEFEEMTPEQQMEFQNDFKNDKDFEKWLEEAQTEGEKTELPWENGGKKPSEYTWAEFNALTPEQQIAFQNSFKKDKDFEKWLNKVNPEREPEIEIRPSIDLGKPSEECTWEEFEAMTPEQQIEFQNSFESNEKLEEWFNKVNPEGNADGEMPSANFEKPLDQYTWEEFEAMSMEEQMIFQKSFKSIEEFDKWLQANEPK